MSRSNSNQGPPPKPRGTRTSAPPVDNAPAKAAPASSEEVKEAKLSEKTQSLVTRLVDSLKAVESPEAGSLTGTTKVGRLTLFADPELKDSIEAKIGEFRSEIASELLMGNQIVGFQKPDGGYLWISKEDFDARQTQAGKKEGSYYHYRYNDYIPQAQVIEDARARNLYRDSLISAVCRPILEEQKIPPDEINIALKQIRTAFFNEVHKPVYGPAQPKK